jgi:hypothetical protein
MDSTTSLLVGAAIVAAIGTLAVWFTLRRPARTLERRQRDEALAAASLYTPAERSPNYGAAPDPCAPGLSDNERVQAMRELLLRGEGKKVEAVDILLHDSPFEPTRPMDPRDPGPTTSPMAWKPTQPLGDADVRDWERMPPQEADDAYSGQREHITL